MTADGGQAELVRFERCEKCEKDNSNAKQEIMHWFVSFFWEFCKKNATIGLFLRLIYVAVMDRAGEIGAISRQ